MLALWPVPVSEKNRKAFWYQCVLYIGRARISYDYRHTHKAGDLTEEVSEMWQHEYT